MLLYTLIYLMFWAVIYYCIVQMGQVLLQTPKNGWCLVDIIYNFSCDSSICHYSTPPNLMTDFIEVSRDKMICTIKLILH